MNYSIRVLLQFYNINNWVNRSVRGHWISINAVLNDNKLQIIKLQTDTVILLICKDIKCS